MSPGRRIELVNAVKDVLLADWHEHGTRAADTAEVLTEVLNMIYGGLMREDADAVECREEAAAIIKGGRGLAQAEILRGT
jgi:hypothetical protein